MALVLDAQHMLRGRRFVMAIARVDHGAVRQQELGDLHGGSEMQRRLPIGAARSAQLRVGRDEFAQFGEHSQPRGGMHVEHGAAVR